MIQYKTIEYLAYLIKEAKSNEKPIVLLGAGASISAGIPGANDIAKMILSKYSDNPEIKDLPEEDRVYAKLMDTLTPSQRNTFLKELIDKAQINVTHIYLAQMMHLGFIDYFLTVNFDNLMQRALALFNIFPPTYDISIFKDITTTSFHPKSITYLHGQHTGFWLLNTKEEMEKVKEVVPSRLDKITNGRPLIIIGYSGNDPIFDHIVNLGRFDNGLYWIGYKDSEPTKKVVEKLLDKPYTNAFLIQGYDSDSFCLKLNSELGNPEPDILAKPFSYLKKVQSSIVDIEDGPIYTDIKVRLDVTKNMVDDSISRYELGIPLENQMTKDEINLNVFKQEIINATIKSDFSQAKTFLLKAKELKDNEINNLLSNFYNQWALVIWNEIKISKPIDKEKAYDEVFKKYEKAKELDENNVATYVNYGSKLNDYARILKGKKGKQYIELALRGYETAAKITEHNEFLYNNWGNAIADYALTVDGEDRMKYLLDSLTKFEKSIQCNLLNENAYNNWGLALQRIALNVNEVDIKKKYFEESFTKLELAIKVNEHNENAYLNLGVGLLRYSEIMGLSDKLVYINLGASQFLKAIQINPNNKNLYYTYASCLINKSYLLQGLERQNCLEDALINCHKAISLGSDYYNLACVTILLGKKTEALKILEESLNKEEVTLELVLNDRDWKTIANDEEFMRIIKNYS